MVALVLLSAVVGILVGLTGIGGILAIPAVMLLTDTPPHAAMATTLAALLLSGMMGTYNYHVMGFLKREHWLPLCAGGLPFTFAGACLNDICSAELLLVILGVIIILSGVSALHAWTALKSVDLGHSDRASWIIGAVGAFSGFMAGLTGASGPVLSIPILIALGMPAFPAVVSGMPFQICASVSGSAGNLLNGHIDFGLLLPLAIPIVLGVVVGNRIAPYIPALLLKRGIGVFCIAIGIYLCYRGIA